MNVGIIGLWHLGSVTSACLANYGYNIIGYDVDKEVIKNLNKGVSPIEEPFLEDLIKENIRKNNLRFTSDLKEAIKDSDFVFLTIDTPVDENDDVDLSSVFSSIDDMIGFLKEDTTIIIQSQVPVGTCNELVNRIKQNTKSKFNLAYCPENLRLGKAIELFQNPDRIIIGADSQETLDKVSVFFDIIGCPKVTMDLKSAEMTKHAINAFLATCISFINWIGNACGETGADANKVSEGLMTEKRIGKNLPLRPGLGFAGGTLGRDLKILINLGRGLKVNPELFEAVVNTNNAQNIIAIKKLQKIFGKLENLTIGILGLTYKPGTNTLRRSSSIEIINEIASMGANVKAFDPAINEINTEMHRNFKLTDNAYATAEKSDVLVVMTDWPEFRDLDYKKILGIIKKPVILDMKNCLDQKYLRGIGFSYHRVG